MKIVLGIGLLLSLSIFNASASRQDEAFQKMAHDYIERYLRANPEEATELGDHRFDGQLTDYSAEARAKDLAAQKEFRDKLNAIDGSQVTGANNVDFREIGTGKRRTFNLDELVRLSAAKKVLQSVLRKRKAPKKHRA